MIGAQAIADLRAAEAAGTPAKITAAVGSEERMAQSMFNMPKAQLAPLLAQYVMAMETDIERMSEVRNALHSMANYADGVPTPVRNRMLELVKLLDGEGC